MPLGKCDRCLARLRFGSGTCSRCGTRKKRLKYFLAALVVVEAGAIAAHMEMPDHGPKFVSDASAAPARMAMNDPKPPAGWIYYDTRDDLVNDVTRHARVLSRSNVGAGNARDHGTTGVLELRRSQVYGNSVLITLKRATFDTVDDQCKVRAMFDTGDVATFEASAASDTDNATVIIADTHGFVGKLAAAQTLSVDVVLSGNTERVASFPVAGLKWD